VLDGHAAPGGAQAVMLVTTQTGRPAWQINGYAAVKALSRDDRLVDADPSLVRARTSEAEELDEPREEPIDSIGWARVLRRAFTPDRVDSLRPRMEQIIHGLLDEIASGKRQPDLHNDFSVPFVMLVSCALLDVPEADGQRTRDWWQALKSGSREEAAEGQAAMLRYVRGLYAARQSDPGDDFISDLIQAQGPGAPYTEDALKFLTSLVSKGRETPTNALDWGLVLLLREPEAYRSLVADPTMVDATVEEVLRLFPVISGKVQGPEGIRRFALCDFTVEASAIRRGDLMLLNVVAANMDATVFPQPDRFDPGRSPNPHLTFGFGPHSCPAARLARLELLVAYTALIERFPTLRLSIDAADLRYRERPTSEGFESLPVTW
jgi:cytochrome P450